MRLFVNGPNPERRDDSDGANFFRMCKRWECCLLFDFKGIWPFDKF
jgi:hypothetical protein